MDCLASVLLSENFQEANFLCRLAGTAPVPAVSAGSLDGKDASYIHFGSEVEKASWEMQLIREPQAATRFFIKTLEGYNIDEMR